MSRRLVDLAVAGTALVVLAPLLAAIALAVWLSDGRPVVFRAVRVGRGGRHFTMLKFRTMRTGSGSRASVITGAGDSRVFRLGSWLRRCKADELPQVVNILRGDMSIVGPRPEDPAIVASSYRVEHLPTLSVRPGLTSPGSLYNYTHGEALLTGRTRRRPTGAPAAAEARAGPRLPVPPRPPVRPAAGRAHRVDDRRDRRGPAAVPGTDRARGGGRAEPGVGRSRDRRAGARHLPSVAGVW